MGQINIKKIVCLIPPHYDFLCATIIDGLQQLGCCLYCSEQTNNSTEKEYTPFKDLLPCCNDCDFILLFSNTNYSNRKQFIIKNNLASKTVYVDGSDQNYLEDPSALNTFNICFKREFPSLKSIVKSSLTSKHVFGSIKRLKRYLSYNKQNILPLPFAAEQSYFKYNKENLKKDINISCTLVPKSCTLQRNKINEFVRNLNIPNTVIGSISRGNYATESYDKSKEEYFRVLAKSKISVSYPGLGFDTGRFWEILANKALLFSPPLQIKMPHPFLEFKHFIPYNTLPQLKNRLLYYLDKEEEREKIANAGYRHLLKYHTSKERARYLLDMILQRLNK
jgi:hypothetical protein